MRVAEDRSAHLEQQRTVGQLGLGVSGRLVAGDDHVAVDLAETVGAERAAVLVDRLAVAGAGAVQVAGVGGELLGDDRERALAGAGTNVQVPDSHVTGRGAGDQQGVLHDGIAAGAERADTAELDPAGLHAHTGVGQKRTQLDGHQVLAAVLRIVDAQARKALVERERGLRSRRGSGGNRLGGAGLGGRCCRDRDGVGLSGRDGGG